MEIYSGWFVVKEKEILRVTLIGLGWDPVLVHNKIPITVGPEDRQESMPLKTVTDFSFSTQGQEVASNIGSFKIKCNSFWMTDYTINREWIQYINVTHSVFHANRASQRFDPCSWDHSLNTAEQNDTMITLIHDSNQWSFFSRIMVYALAHLMKKMAEHTLQDIFWTVYRVPPPRKFLMDNLDFRLGLGFCCEGILNPLPGVPRSLTSGSEEDSGHARPLLSKQVTIKMAVVSGSHILCFSADCLISILLHYLKFAHTGWGKAKETAILLASVSR